MIMLSFVVLSDFVNDGLESGVGNAGDGGGDLRDLLFRTPKRDPL